MFHLSCFKGFVLFSYSTFNPGNRKCIFKINDSHFLKYRKIKHRKFSLKHIVFKTKVSNRYSAHFFPKECLHYIESVEYEMYGIYGKNLFIIL